jgi:hypothetical protein
LPDQGVVVGRPGGVSFLDLNGDVVGHVEDFRVYFEWTVPGAVILRSHRAFFVLDVAGHELLPLPSEDAAFELVPQFQEGVDIAAGEYLDLELPAGGRKAGGFWAYALPSPDESAILAQWSGECEVPLAFFLSGDGRDPEAVFGGGGLGDAPESRGLGWTEDGRAVVQLMQGLCGNGGHPGVYLIHPGERPGLIMRLPENAVVRMWGPG